MPLISPCRYKTLLLKAQLKALTNLYKPMAYKREFTVVGLKHVQGVFMHSHQQLVIL